MPATQSPFPVVASFTDGNDSALLALVPETAAIVAKTVKDDKSAKAAPVEDEEAADVVDQVDDVPSDEVDEVVDAADPADPAADEVPAELTPEVTAELEQLRTEVAELKARPVGEIALVPTAESPLSHMVSEQQLSAFGVQCDDTLEWITDNPEGGEVPDELAAVLLGKQVSELTEPLVLDKEQTRALRKRTKAMLADHLPQRLAHLKTEAAVLAVIRKESPEILDPAKPLGKLVAGIMQEVPQLRSFAQWPALMRDWARGYSARLAEEAKKPGAKPFTPPSPPRTGTTASGKTVPLAPATSAGGIRSAAAPAMNATTRAAQARIAKGKGTEADHLAMLSLSE